MFLCIQIWSEHIRSFIGLQRMSLPAVSRSVAAAECFLCPFRAPLLSPGYRPEQGLGAQHRWICAASRDTAIARCHLPMAARRQERWTPQADEPPGRWWWRLDWKNLWDLQWWRSLLQMQGVSELTNWQSFELFLKVCWILTIPSSFRNVSKILYEFIAFKFFALLYQISFLTWLLF